MKLRAKLFLALGILLFCYAVVIFLIPSYIIQLDVDRVANRLHNLAEKQNEINLRDQEEVLSSILQITRETIDSFLFVVYDMQNLRKSVAKEEQLSDEERWHFLVQLANYSPDIGFLQLDAIDRNEHILLTPAEATLYEAEVAPVSEGVVAIRLPSKEEHFLGIAIAENHFILVPWDSAKSLLQQEEKDVASFESHFKERKLLEGSPSDAPTALRGDSEWAIKNNLIQLLMPLVIAKNFEVKGEKWTPAGIVSVDKQGKAKAMLTREIASDQPLFDAAAYYNAHPPLSPNEPPIAEGEQLVANKTLHHVFLANTLKAEHFYLSMGAPIDPLAKQLAIWMGKTVAIRIDNQLWIGYDEQGNRYSEEKMTPFLTTGNLNQGSGTVKIGGESYLFSNLAQLENGKVGFYTFTPVEKAEAMAMVYVTVAKKLSWKISWQLFFISLLLIAIILFTIMRIVLRNTIRPVIKLAAATEEIKAGRYEEVELPDSGKRKDEVATLIHAFGEMVIALQEKERIRGVLNKVVSKDVADEILKSNIHLGGEDRLASVLFGDIRGFTHLTEHLSPQETIGMLNECMTKVSHVIEGEGGVIDKYVGDEVMAIYGAPAPHPDHALRAVSSGLLILKFLKQWNEERAQKGEPLVQMGIGVHSGLVVAGNMGAENRLNYTVLGANVNLAARLCQIAEVNQLVVSKQTLQENGIEDSFEVRSLPPIKLKGFTDAIEIYEVIDFKW